MKRFEYKTVIIEATGFWSTKFPPEDIDRTLNEYGRGGWELVCVESYTSAGSTYKLMYTFKREM